MPVQAIEPLQLRTSASPDQTIDVPYIMSVDNLWGANPIVEDFNRDGLDDLIWIPSNYRTGNIYDSDGLQWPRYPFIYFESKGDGTFFDNTEELFPGYKYIDYTDRYIYEDLDGDGLKDLLFIDSGYESLPENPLVLPDMMVGNALQDENGDPWTIEITHQGAVLHWWKASNSGPYTAILIDDNYLAFHHNGSAADLDLDGDKEIVIGAIGTYLEVTDKGIDSFLAVEDSDQLLYQGVMHQRVPDSEILAAGHRPVIVLELTDNTNQFKLNFELLPDDSMRQITVRANGGFKEMLNVNTVELNDLDNDGYPDMIVGIGISYSNGPIENRIYLNQKGTFATSTPILLPFPEIAQELANRNSAVTIESADIDGNGLIDIGIGFENPGNGVGAGHYFQLWSQTSELRFEDITLDSIGTFSTKALLDLASEPFGSSNTSDGAPSEFKFQDVNNDGHYDIVFYTNLVGFYELGGGVLINDGIGNFAPLHHSNFTAPQQRKNVEYPDQASGKYGVVFGDFNGDGLTDHIVIEYEEYSWVNGFPNALREPAYLYAFSNIATTPISLLSNGYKVWDPDQIGFNEFFYSKTQPEAANAVSTGNYKTLYQYYLSEGRFNGDLPIASGSIIRGTEKYSDTIYIPGKASKYSVVALNNGDLELNTNDATTWKLKTVERLIFEDYGLAFDLGYNAGYAAKALGAFLGADSLTPENVGIVLNLLDGGLSYEGLLSEANTAIFGSDPAGSDMVGHFYMNLFGEQAPEEILNTYGSLIDNGELSAVDLAKSVADSDANIENINLIGLSSTGIEFLLG